MRRLVPALLIWSTFWTAASCCLAEDKHPAISRLFIAQSDGSGMKQLFGMSDYEYHGSPRWSPDGKLLAFNVWNRGETDRNGQIAVMHADGGNARILVDGLMPSFSPDGKRIAFTRHQPHPGIWVVNVDGGKQELTQIDPTGWGADWSSGDKLAFPIMQDGQTNLAVYDMAKRQRELLWAADSCPYSRIFWGLAWSRDGKRIAFKGNTIAGQPELAIIDARGAKQGLNHRLQEDIQPGFAWNAEGEILFCKSCPERKGRSQVYALTADGNVPPQLLPGQDASRSFADVALSADGKQLAVMGLLQSPAQIRAVRADIAPERLTACFVANFRGKHQDLNALRLLAGTDARFLQPGEDGLRLNLPAGEKKPDQTGIVSDIRIRGDFELIAEFRSLNVEKPAEGWGAGFDLLMEMGQGPKDYILIERKVSGAGEHVLATKHANVGLDGRYKWNNQHAQPNDVVAGKLKVVRKKSMVYYLFANHDSEDYQLLDEKLISDADIQRLKFVVCAKDTPSGSDVILEQLSIRAESLPEFDE